LVFVGFIRVYKKLLSPILPRSCRYYPSCSDYAEEAVKLHGPFRGALLSAKRVLRCSPLFPGGYDPVPKRERGKA